MNIKPVSKTILSIPNHTEKINPCLGKNFNSPVKPNRRFAVNAFALRQAP
jgi:hypothetical protein